ncbi:uncharacterized protein LOC142342458 [Convolutriloba macropyga]|uniref:uncharacterized protein LOC142342458 n=1 Tax=Convolutriloba macropyga TaxID=536237 RepID=UPI003F51BCC3
MLTQLAIITISVVYLNADYIVDRRYDPDIVDRRYDPDIVDRRYDPEIVDRRYNPEIVDRRYDPFMFYKRQGIRYNMNSKEGDACEEPKDCDKYKQLYCNFFRKCDISKDIEIPTGCDQNERCPSGQLCDVYRKNCFTPTVRRGQDFESRQVLF